jgi:hypothetical protein
MIYDRQINREQLLCSLLFGVVGDDLLAIIRLPGGLADRELSVDLHFSLLFDDIIKQQSDNHLWKAIKATFNGSSRFPTTFEKKTSMMETLLVADAMQLNTI